MITFSWIFFRANDLSHAMQYISNSMNNLDSYFNLETYLKYSKQLTLISVFMIVEWLGREEQYGYAFISKVPNTLLRYLSHYILIIIILWVSWYKTGSNEFIYFQF